MKLVIGSRRKHLAGWLLLAAGILLLWVWWNFRETFGGTFNLYIMHMEVDASVVPFIAGIACLIMGALRARGGWNARLYRVPLRNLVGALLLVAAASTVRPLDLTARADTWVAFRLLRTRQNSKFSEAPRGMT